MDRDGRFFLDFFTGSFAPALVGAASLEVTPIAPLFLIVISIFGLIFGRQAVQHHMRASAGATFGPQQALPQFSSPQANF